MGDGDFLALWIVGRRLSSECMEEQWLHLQALASVPCAEAAMQCAV